MFDYTQIYTGLFSYVTIYTTALLRLLQQYTCWFFHFYLTLKSDIFHFFL